MRREFTSINLNAKFYVFLVGRGEGCGYTIGCNVEFWSLSAQTLEEAQKEVADEHVGEGGAHENAIIIEASQVVVFDMEKQMREMEDKAEEERKEYERLKLKFGSEDRSEKKNVVESPGCVISWESSQSSKGA